MQKKIRIKRTHNFATIMRITSLAAMLTLTIAMAATAHPTFGQAELENRTKVSFSRIPLSKALEELQSKTGIPLAYRSSQLPDDATVTYNANKKVRDILKDILTPHHLMYEVRDGFVVLKEAPQGVNIGQVYEQSNIEIRGTVRDSTGNLIEGVTVSVKGTPSIGTTTDLNGRYTLSVPPQSILIFTSVGYQSQEQATGSRQVIDIVLIPTEAGLDEVVVVGYGTQRRENLTGAITVVDSKLLQSRPAANVSSLLQGTVPNLQVTFGSGRPGAAGSLNIRGINSISSTASPLVIIDGFEADLNRINPNDVESITVLKDASAAAVYGARASYGVILITTKTGSGSRAQITYSGQTSMSAQTTSTDFETRGYYSAAINDLFFSRYAGSNYTRYTDDDYYQLWLRRDDKEEHPDRPWVIVDNRDGRESYVYYGNTDWYNHLFNLRRPMHTHNLSVNGVSDKIKYSLTGNYFNQEGIFRQSTDDLKRYNMRSRVDFSVNKWLDINTNLSYFNSAYAYPGPGGIENSFNSAVVHGLASIVPVNPDGTQVYQTSISNYNLMDGYAALLGQDLHRNMDKISEFSPTIEAVIKPFKGFDIHSSYRFIHYNYQTMNRSANIAYSKYPNEILEIASGIGDNRLTEAQINHQYRAVNMYATYQTVLNNDHDIKAMAGYNYETKYLKDIRVARNGLLSDQIIDFNTATGDVMQINGGQNEYALFGTFYRFNYGYKDRYLFETAGRYDGTSRFAKGSRFGFFPSFSAAWRMDKENFFQAWDQNVLAGFKVRASYGSLGNQQVGYYDYLQTINAGHVSSNYSFGEGLRAPFATESAPNSSSLTWETVNTTNFGIDIELFKSRLSVVGDIYRRETLNMLTAGRAIPAYYGANIPRENASDLLTKGWEASINWRDGLDIGSRRFNYYVGAGVGDNISTITRFDNPNRNISNFYEGQTLGQIWGYEVNGFFKTDEEAANYDVDQTAVNSIINSSAVDLGLHAGDLKFEDLDGDKKISLGDNTADNPGDRRIIGNSLPRYNFNFTLGGDWNNFDLSVFVQGIGRQNWYPNPNASYFWGPYAQPYATFIGRDFLGKVWSEENPDAYFPRPRGYIALNNTNRSLGVANTKYLQDLAYVRLKNITVGYSLPKEIASKAGLTRLRVYFSGENLLTFTKLESKYIDPEQASTQNNHNTSTSHAKYYPWAKTFMFGLDISL